MNTTILTERIDLRPDPHLVRLTNQSRIVFNKGQYVVRQSYADKAPIVRFVELSTILRDEPWYRHAKTILGAKTTEQTLRAVDATWTSYFAALKAYKLDPSKFNGKPRVPGYANKRFGPHRLFPVFIAARDTKYRNGLVTTPAKIGLTFDPNLADVQRLRGGTLVPEYDRFVFYLHYEVELPELMTGDRIAAIDPGINNLMTVANNIGKQPFIIPGGPIKSINHYFNKHVAKLQARYATQGIESGAKYRLLVQKRDRKILDYLHKASRWVVNWCVEHDINTIIFGYNEGWKQNVSNGKRFNQKFTYVPFHKLLHQLDYKARCEGIAVEPQQESYTSKCSFLDDEPIGYHHIYAGRRRGSRFWTADGTHPPPECNRPC